MSLSKGRRERIDTLYHIWGIDLVQEELARSEKDPFAEPDVIEFTRAWIAEEENAMWGRNRREMAVLTLACAFLAGIVALPLFG